MTPLDPPGGPTATGQLTYLAGLALSDGAPPIGVPVINGASAPIRRRLARTGRWLLCGLLLASGAGVATGQETLPADEAVPASEWMERQVRSVERTLYGAQFRSALGIAAQLRDHPAATNRQKIRLELAHATAAIALGEEEAGEQSLGRILQLDPAFTLSEKDSPKLRRALANVRKVGP